MPMFYEYFVILWFSHSIGRWDQLLSNLIVPLLLIIMKGDFSTSIQGPSMGLLRQSFAFICFYLRRFSIICLEGLILNISENNVRTCYMLETITSCTSTNDLRNTKKLKREVSPDYFSQCLRVLDYA